MIQIQGDKFYSLAAHMRAAIESYKEIGKIESSGRTVPQDKAKNLLEKIHSIARVSNEKFLVLGFTSVQKQSERMEERIKNSDCTIGDAALMMEEFQNRLIDEMQSVVFLLVPAQHRPYYEGVDLFGNAVTSKFQDATFDIGEAGKCLALDRGTACVMHLMRVIELAVDAIALGVGVHEAAVKATTTWEHLLKEINSKIQEANKTKIPMWVASQSFFENAYIYLLAVKNAWRNPSMHLDKKYTEEEASRIYSAVKDLMEHLGEHLDQSGAFTP